MSWLWDTAAVATPVGTEPWANLSVYLINGVKTALTHYAGSTDPSVGALTAWTSADVGVKWLDTTDPANPVWKLRQQVTGGPTYGWRPLRTPKLKMLTTPVDVIAAASIAADAIYADVSLAALLDGAAPEVQDPSCNACVVRLVLLNVYMKPTAAVPGGDKCWIALREKGTTNEIKVHGQVNGVPRWERHWVGLNASEVLQRQYDANGGTATFDVQVQIVGLVEFL